MVVARPPPRNRNRLLPIAIPYRVVETHVHAVSAGGGTGSCGRASKNRHICHALPRSPPARVRGAAVSRLRTAFGSPPSHGSLTIRDPLMNAPFFGRLALIGVGLIGSSIARAARAQKLVGSIVATARSAKTRRRAMELGLADQVVETNAAAVEGADLVVVCIPVGQCGAVAREIAPHLPANVHFLPAHPVAGTEYSGPDAGFAELFIGRWCIVTPPERADAVAVERLSGFWSGLGAKVATMSAEHHDLVLAITSHVPHLIAYTIVGTADDLSAVTRSEVLQYSAVGFRDFTRIAASDPTMWRDVFLANKTGVLEMLNRFNRDLAKLAQAIEAADGDTLFDLFTRTRAIRRGIVAIGQDSAAPDFGRSRSTLAPSPLLRPYASEE